LDFPALDAAQPHSEILESVPRNVRWQLELLLPQMIGKLAPEGTAYTVRVALDRDGEKPERLQSIEILDSASGKTVDGAWWLERPGGPGVLIGMKGLEYERLLWQTPVKYLRKSRGTGPAVTTFRRRVTVPQSNGKTTVRTVTVREYHMGSDLMAPKGTEVHTVGDGRVTFAGRMGGFGKLIILDHGLGYQTYYAHLSSIGSSIKAGTRVARGDVIGLVGSTGRSTAPHLHFETRKDAKFLDPFDNTRQWDFWLLTPGDQEKIAMELLAVTSTSAVAEGDDAVRRMLK
jgi:murein DD-endopeptidase MepM/ murein hydrolase activator NlpD